MKTKIVTLVTLAILGLSNAYSQVGIGTTSPDTSSILDLDVTSLPATGKLGFLPPRMTTAERDAIISPAEGLVIFNTDANCLEWFSVSFRNGSGWYNACDGTIDIITPGNSTCSEADISATPCAAVPGATLSASQPYADGTLYDWTDSTSYMGGTTSEALVEIGDQCWFRRNTTTASPYTGTNDVDTFYNNAGLEPAVGEGRLYQWNAAMYGSTTERAQGVCPTGWHVPSDCEWMYLENTLGMSTTDQQLNNTYRGTQGRKLSTLVLAPATNSSGFTALRAGYRHPNGTFFVRGSFGFWWSSSEISTTLAQSRALFSSQAGVSRGSGTKDTGFSVRCLKD